MQTFELDQQLQSDTLILGEFDLSMVLVMNNALVPWFVLVPRVNADIVELYQLSVSQQSMLMTETNVISRFLHQELKVDKINIGTIGNIVRQLHIHVIGRYKNDFAWPATVWGRKEKEIYDPVQYENITHRFRDYLDRVVDNA